MNTPSKKPTPKKAPPKKSSSTPKPLSTAVMDGKQNVINKPPAAVKPVATPAKEKAEALKTGKVAAERVIRAPKTTGNYKWLLRRFQAQATNQLTTSSNRATVRDGLAKCETYSETEKFLQQSKVADEAALTKFRDFFFSATINR